MKIFFTFFDEDREDCFRMPVKKFTFNQKFLITIKIYISNFTALHKNSKLMYNFWLSEIRLTI